MTHAEAITVGDLFAEYGRNLARRARRILGSESDAEDVVQEVMLSLLESPHVLAGVEHLGAWLYTVVRRRCIDLIRKDGRQRRREKEVGMDALFEEEPDPAVLMDQEGFSDAVAEAVRGLPETAREAFVKNALERKTFRKIAEETGVPMGTWMARKAKAVALIRGRLEEEGWM